jgi:L-ribulose-5-phosphate 3-epimerase UlaE
VYYFDVCCYVTLFTFHAKLPTGSTDTNVDTNSGECISKVCTVTTKKNIKRHQCSEIQEYTEKNMR